MREKPGNPFYCFNFASNASTDDFVERFLSAKAWISVDQGPTIPRSQTQYESRELMALLAHLDRKDREWKPSYPFVVLPYC
jgi:hypothetical protein